MFAHLIAFLFETFSVIGKVPEGSGGNFPILVR